MIDNYDLWAAHDRRMENALERRPVCDRCKEHIQEDAYRIEGELLCRDCAMEWLEEQKEDLEEDDEWI